LVSPGASSWARTTPTSIGCIRSGASPAATRTSGAGWSRPLRDGRPPARTCRSPCSSCPSSSAGPATGYRTGQVRWTVGRGPVHP
jgi:hypothetical protein